MALGFSGSNGGIKEAYRQFVLADIDAGIHKYTILYDSVTKESPELQDFYQTTITNLKDLKQKMLTKGLESKL